MDPTQITGLEDFPTAPALVLVGDGEHGVLTCMHQQTPGSSEIPHATCYLVDLASWAAVKVIGQSAPLVKDSGAFPVAIPNAIGQPQDIAMVVTEEGIPRGGGFTNVMNVYVWHDAAPGPAQWIDHVAAVQFSRLSTPESGVARLVQKVATDAAAAAVQALAKALGLAVAPFE